jgi:hypothetical protein
MALVDPQINRELAQHGAVRKFIPTGITMENTVGKRAVGGSNLGRYFNSTGMEVGTSRVVDVRTGDAKLTDAERAYAEAVVKLRNEKAYGGADIVLARG